MKRFFCLGLVSLATLTAAPPANFSLEQGYPETLVVNNRILLKLNGQAITVMDVTRKMDLLFYRQYPELASSNLARYQYYVSGWRMILSAVIDESLIMADAEEKEVVVNDGEVREELEKLFGPEVVINLDKLGMTLEEAFDLLKTELTVQRMTSIMVRSRAMSEVHPTTIRERYKKVLEENPPQNYWIYRILSIRGQDHERVANIVYNLMKEQEIPFEELAYQIEEEGIDISCSEEYRQIEKDLSSSYRTVLESLAVGVVSTPVSNSKGSRLFCLKAIEKKEPPSFKEVEDELKNELTQEAMTRYQTEYRQKLHKQYGLTEQYLSLVIPPNLQPFALK
ncbi:MAG TPA: hypothetical protein VIH61_08630 [Waddliaceae bacterium]